MSGGKRRRMRRSRRRLHEVKCAEKNIVCGSNFFSYKGLICHKLGAMKSMFDIVHNGYKLCLFSCFVIMHFTPTS
jgi:hypothetical protein